MHCLQRQKKPHSQRLAPVGAGHTGLGASCWGSCSTWKCTREASSFGEECCSSWTCYSYVALCVRLARAYSHQCTCGGEGASLGQKRRPRFHCTAAVSRATSAPKPLLSQYCGALTWRAAQSDGRQLASRLHAEY